MHAITHIYCCWHPDFIQVDDSYTVLDTGKYVVEWDEIDKTDRKLIFFKTIYNRKHYTKDFTTLEDAARFMNYLHTKQNSLTSKKQ
jgi:hypothetical protein